MRNVFDQYSQPENRVTHALISALNEDRDLLGRFLRELVRLEPPTPPAKLSVLEQQLPGEEEMAEEDLERRGIPDAWIFDDSGWCVFIETKVMAELHASQILSHYRTAERRGFTSATAVAIVPRVSARLPDDALVIEWRKIYAWLRRHRDRHTWAARAAEYLEIAEAKLIATGQFVEGTLTMFSGFPFEREHPFTYLEGKRVLGLALGKLRTSRELKERLGMKPEAPGRPAITGRQEEAVWDFLSIASNTDNDAFTKNPHLTLGISAHAVEAMVTVPNAIDRAIRRRIAELGEDGFQALGARIVANLAPLIHENPGALPWCRGVQRRYPSQRARPFIDARIDFDLRTAIEGIGPPKEQPRWLSAAYGSFVNRGKSNYQLQMGVHFPYETCPKLKEPDATNMVAAAWLGCEPLLELAR